MILKFKQMGMVILVQHTHAVKKIQCATKVNFKIFKIQQ